MELAKNVLIRVLFVIVIVVMLVCRSSDDSECTVEISADVDGGDGSHSLLSLCGRPARPPTVHGSTTQQVCPQCTQTPEPLRV